MTSFSGITGSAPAGEAQAIRLNATATAISRMRNSIFGGEKD
jgi:hypothetical protein